MTVLDDIAEERDKMIARSRRGIAKDDGKTAEEWGASLGHVLSGGYPPRHMWVKIAAVAVRAAEAIDRRATSRVDVR